MKTKKQLIEEIEKLKKEVEALKEPKSKYARVEYSNRKNILLQTEDGKPLISAWFYENYLNDFEFIEKENSGQFFIFGKNKSFILKNEKGKVLFKSNEYLKGIFLEDDE